MKQKEVKQLSIEDIKLELDNMKSHYKQLKVNHSVTPLENPLELRALRRTIARLSTEFNGKKSNN